MSNARIGVEWFCHTDITVQFATEVQLRAGKLNQTHLH
eukprot:gene1978-5234_t